MDLDREHLHEGEVDIFLPAGDRDFLVGDADVEDCRCFENVFLMGDLGEDLERRSAGTVSGETDLEVACSSGSSSEELVGLLAPVGSSSAESWSSDGISEVLSSACPATGLPCVVDLEAAAKARGFQGSAAATASPTGLVDASLFTVVPAACLSDIFGDFRSLAVDLDLERSGDTLSDCLSLKTDLDFDMSLLGDFDSEHLFLFRDLDLGVRDLLHGDGDLDGLLRLGDLDFVLLRFGDLESIFCTGELDFLQLLERDLVFLPVGDLDSEPFLFLFRITTERERVRLPLLTGDRDRRVLGGDLFL